MSTAVEAFEAARRIADAVLYEGYVLYPYRASAPKNLLRWQFGVLAPRSFSEAHGSEHWWSQTECLADSGGDARLAVRVRGLHVVPGADGWDEGVAREIDLDGIDLGIAGDHTLEFAVGGAVDAVLQVTTNPLPGPYRLTRVRARVENVTDWDDPAASRDEMLRRSFVGVHLLLHVAGGRFLSLADPPEFAADIAHACVNEHTWPALVDDHTVLSSPIILSDRPEVAPESPGDMFDATEIDELLALRVLTLTDAEKEEARRTDPRAAAVIDRVEQLSPAAFGRLHGAIRSVRPGAKVRLRPGESAGRRTDAQDIFIDGRVGTVQAVLEDLDGARHVAVVLDDDPASDLHQWQGRYRYFHPDEVEPIE